MAGSEHWTVRFDAGATVRNNLTRIYDKLEISGGRLGLLVYAYRHGLVKPSP